ncbi:tRNA (guanosine(46)-N7)-methyltransferase TrmB [Sneathia vaginalis]|uniref:tRNA (guanosine(46)-N7)-methyltransferase TrmB n=1 Tax=Sneathia vaginalis TaxID=187101 RepID=UPI000698F07B|nr:tRNA (guanosine(46)-N7)-methyltransferase TrmB [Sneathia vaginalis]
MIEYKGKELWTYFFNKPKNHYNQYMFEMINYESFLYFDEEEILSFKKNWSKVFNNTNPIFLEIGSGSGNFLIELASKNPLCNYIGDELRLKRLVYASRKAKNHSLNNVKFIRIDANKLDKFLDNGELSGVYINFPDPWENEEHKRILSNDLLEKLYPILKENGKIFFKTDHTDYYNSVLKLISKNEKYKLVFNTDDLHSTELRHDNIKTEFEHLFINKIKTTIKYIEIIKC